MYSDAIFCGHQFVRNSGLVVHFFAVAASCRSFLPKALCRLVGSFFRVQTHELKFLGFFSSLRLMNEDVGGGDKTSLLVVGGSKNVGGKSNLDAHENVETVARAGENVETVAESLHRSEVGLGAASRTSLLDKIGKTPEPDDVVEKTVVSGSAPSATRLHAGGSDRSTITINGDRDPTSSSTSVGKGQQIHGKRVKMSAVQKEAAGIGGDASGVAGTLIGGDRARGTNSRKAMVLNGSSPMNTATGNNRGSRSLGGIGLVSGKNTDNGIGLTDPHIGTQNTGRRDSKDRIHEYFSL